MFENVTYQIDVEKRNPDFRSKKVATFFERFLPENATSKIFVRKGYISHLTIVEVTFGRSKLYKLLESKVLYIVLRFRIRAEA